MSEHNQWQKLAEDLRTFLVWAISGLMDAIFVAIWVSVQWFLDSKVIASLQLSGIDSFVLLAFRVMFSIATLAPVAIYIYTDIRVMVLQAQRKIRKEQGLRKANGREIAP